jgi:peptide deformylase
MAILDILIYPDPRLREVADPVEQVDDEIRTLVEDMAETMYDAPGVGLAATQVGVKKRVFIIDIADEDEPSNLQVFINPEILQREGTQSWKEGCLSFPEISEEIKRAEQVVVRALDVSGAEFELEADGLLAVAVQHENDHLDGVLMVDKVSPLRRRLIGRKLAKRQAVSS